ncbi:MAG TPA: hypothetical protein VF916_11375, partial [Ktedonobacterales bacterium]
MGTRDDALTLEHLAARLAEVEQANADLRREAADLRREVVQLRVTQQEETAEPVLILPDAAAERAQSEEDTPPPTRHRSSRRALLKLGGVAAAAGVAGVLLSEQSGAAQAAPEHHDGSTFYNSVTGSGNVAIFGQGFSGGGGLNGFTDSGFGVWGHAESADPGNPGTAGYFTNANGGGSAYGRGVLGIAQHGEGVWGPSAYSAGTVGEAQSTSFSPGVLGVHDGTGYGVQAYSSAGAIDLLVGVNSKQGIIGQVLWGGSGVQGLLAGTQLRDANADMWIGVWGAVARWRRWRPATRPAGRSTTLQARCVCWMRVGGPTAAWSTVGRSPPTRSMPCRWLGWAARVSHRAPWASSAMSRCSALAATATSHSSQLGRRC